MRSFDPLRLARPGRIDHLNHHVTVTCGDDSEAGTTEDRIAELQLEHQARQSLCDFKQLKSGEANGRRSHRSKAAWHTQVMGIVEVLVRARGKSPLTTEDLDGYPQIFRTTSAPTLNIRRTDIPDCSSQRVTGVEWRD
ncbi:MAG: hypothetical protein Q4G21_02770 [Dermabacter sp.]|nr:hypothetical protein [Dermabacter sp.]